MKKFLKIISILILTSLLAPVALAAEVNPPGGCPTVGLIQQVGVDQVVYESDKWIALKQNAFPKHGNWEIAVFPFTEQSADKILLKANEALANLEFKDFEPAPGVYICKYRVLTKKGKDLNVWATLTTMHINA
jgi:hypothetical protein